MTTTSGFASYGPTRAVPDFLLLENIFQSNRTINRTNALRLQFRQASLGDLVALSKLDNGICCCFRLVIVYSLVHTKVLTCHYNIKD